MEKLFVEGELRGMEEKHVEERLHAKEGLSLVAATYRCRKWGKGSTTWAGRTRKETR